MSHEVLIELHDIFSLYLHQIPHFLIPKHLWHRFSQASPQCASTTPSYGLAIVSLSDGSIAVTNGIQRPALVLGWLGTMANSSSKKPRPKANVRLVNAIRIEGAYIYWKYANCLLTVLQDRLRSAELQGHV